jgi:hypothetical protein
MKSYKMLSYIFSFFLVFTLVFFPAVSSGDEEAPMQVVEVEGSSLVSGHDLARARNEALQDALQKAVMQAVGRFVVPQDMERKLQLIRERIAIKAEEFIQDYRVVSETTSLDIHIVLIRATVFAESIRKELHESGVIKREEQKTALTELSLTIRGIRTYSDYLRCRSVLKERLPGIRTVLPKEASWGVVRFDMTTDVTLAAITELIREKMATEIRHDGGLTLEATLK